MKGYNIALDINPKTIEINSRTRFEEMKKCLKETIGSTLEPSDEPIFFTMFRNGYLAALKDFGEGKIVAKVTEASLNIKTSNIKS